MAAVIGGHEFLATQLAAGADGGFEEVVAYTIGNVWMCLRDREQFDAASMLPRAVATLNNLLNVHAFLAVDGHSRALRPELDSYYTVFSLAVVPDDWEASTARDLLLRMDKLSFQSEIGHGRIHNIGISSPNDLTIRPFNAHSLDIWAQAITNEVVFDVHQQLLLSAIRRLNRQEYFLAVLDAESAVETCIAELIRRAMRDKGSSDHDIDIAFENQFNRLQQQIVYFDRLSVSMGATQRFENSDQWKKWNSQLAQLRHDIVHRGVRELVSDQARRAVSAGIEAVVFLEKQIPSLVTGLRWESDFAKLQSVKDDARKLIRLFDA